MGRFKRLVSEELGRRQVWLFFLLALLVYVLPLILAEEGREVQSYLGLARHSTNRQTHRAAGDRAPKGWKSKRGP